MKRSTVVALVAICASVGGCAGRDPQYIARSAPWDASLSCEQIQYMVASNEREIADLEVEKSSKTTSNVGWAVGGIFFPPAWLMMDVKGAQQKEIAGYRARNEALTEQAARNCHQMADNSPKG